MIGVWLIKMLDGYNICFVSTAEKIELVKWYVDTFAPKPINLTKLAEWCLSHEIYAGVVDCPRKAKARSDKRFFNRIMKKCKMNIDEDDFLEAAFLQNPQKVSELCEGASTAELLENLKNKFWIDKYNVPIQPNGLLSESKG